MKDADFRPLARGKINTASGCQMMSYPHVDLNRNENKTPHILAIFIATHV